MSLSLSIWVAVHQPWLGVALQSQDNLPGAYVDHVEKNSPAELILSQGDNILSLQAVIGPPVEIQPSDLVEDPDIFPTLGEYNAFLSRQGVLAEILLEPVVKLNLEDGREVRVQPAPTRPISSLPIQFWLLNAIGIIIFMIGAGVLSVRPNDIAPRLFFGSGIGLLISTSSIAVIVSREIAFDPGFLDTVRAIYHFGNGTYTISGIGLLYYYPVRLSSFPLTRLTALLVSFFWLNERFEWTDFPGHTTFIQPIIYFAIGVTIGFLQWRKSRGRPVDRAALKWFLVSYLGFVGIGWFIYFVLSLIHGRAVVPISAGLGAIMFMYIGMALGILKYRLFDIDRWWFNIWLWFFAGASILAVDGLLAFTLALKPSISLTVALILTGWLYFPVRQWIWGRVYRKSATNLEHSLPAIVAGIVDTGRSGDAAWEKVLKEVFKPLSFNKLSEQISASKLEKHGEVMLIPAFSGNSTIELGFANNGNRLFSPADIHLAGEIQKIALQTEDRLAAYNRGVDEERERIMRDLHDDIGGRLLSLVHLAKNKREKTLTRETLKALRDITYSIGPDRSVSVGEALANWRYEMRERCDGAEVSLHWEADTVEDDRPMTPRQLTNISRVLSEAASNAFSHAGSKNIWIRWEQKDGSINGNIRNDGKMPENNTITYGKGIKNMERRISDLDGSFTYETHPEDGLFEVRFSVPFHTES
ncbi:MAG: sensor histidine kinase [bacterium]